jgi:acyl carrier protein
LPAKKLVGLQYEPEKGAPAKSVKQKPGGRQANWFAKFNRSEVLQKICDDLSDINQITKAIESYGYRHRLGEVSVEFAPGDTLETTLSKIWRKALGKQQIGLNENFFEAGGTSLKAVQLIALVQKQLKRSLSITTLFECPTIKLLAEKLKGASDGRMKQTDAAEALVRGRQRRSVRTKRKAFLK